MNLSNIKILFFDCYGTLIDWETGLLNTLSPWIKGMGINKTDEEILDLFSKIEPQVQAETPGLNYRKVLMTVISKMGESFGIEVNDDRKEIFGNSVVDWPPFSDSLQALQTLQKHYKLVILSNIDKESIEQTIQNHFAVDFYQVYTAEEIGSYKPDLRNFHHMLEQLLSLGYKKENIMHVAQSLFHDHVPAKKLGLRSVWIDRRMSKEGSGATMIPQEDVAPDYRFESMGEFVKTVLVN